MVPLFGVVGDQCFQWILLMKLRMSECRLLMKVLSKVLGLKDKIPGMVPTSIASRVVWLIVQLTMSVVVPSTPVIRAVALRVSSR